MARMKKRLKGSTLIETLVSMTLIIIIIGASFASLTAIAGSTGNQSRVFARFAVRNMMCDDHLAEETDTVMTDCGGFMIETTLSVSEIMPDLRIVELTALTPDGKKLFSARRIIALSMKGEMEE